MALALPHPGDQLLQRHARTHASVGSAQGARNSGRGRRGLFVCLFFFILVQLREAKAMLAS